MLKSARFVYLLSASLLFMVATPSMNGQQQDTALMQMKEMLRLRSDSLLNSPFFSDLTGYRPGDSIRIDRVITLKSPHRFRLYTGQSLAYAPFREETIHILYREIAGGLSPEYSEYGIELYAGKKELGELVPNYYRSSSRAMDKDRFYGKLKRKQAPLVNEISTPWMSNTAMFNTNIALWHSHGWYYESSLDRWEWQRARLFQTVEDIYPMAYTLPFLVPMLENAGATVLMPRERDWQTAEVIVDNNGSSGNSLYFPALQMEAGPDSTGFARGLPPYVDENPFRLGTYETMKAVKEAGAEVQWIPEIPESGSYAVYISYSASKEHIDDALYTVYYTGGRAEFRVNQQMGGSTWIYLGHFPFEKGLNHMEGKVVLSNESSRPGKNISADAVRFGGGMGNISRNGQTSLRPRYQEASRYYLQYAGMPDSLVWKLNENGDYKDDYQGRGEWVNYLRAPLPGRKIEPGSSGLDIPVDLSFAFHTDAGVTDNDTVVGTLGIYSTSYDRGTFPDGLSKMSSRDLSDLIQTQIVADLRELYDPAWTRRGLWDKAYSEAYRAEVPTMLLELFSHQNFLDMQFGQDPMFRFQVSRAIYKGMLKFLSVQYGLPYVVQPLPLTHMQSRIDNIGAIELSWLPVEDELEPTAKAESYVVYTRIDGKGFDRGTRVEGNSYKLKNPKPGSIYSFKVTALNEGGESFPSEIISAGIAEEAKSTLAIITAFDRVSGPARMKDESHAGFLNMVDEGVPFFVDIHTVGVQYDFRKDSPWLDDDSPGHGASYADQETMIIAGNTFDFASVHGSSMLEAGYSFVSISDEVLEDLDPDLSIYPAIDFLAGEEKSVLMPKNDSVWHYRIWTEETLSVLRNYLHAGGAIFINGAHIASDAHMHGQDQEVAELFKFKWRTSNASRTGKVYCLDEEFLPKGQIYSFNTDYLEDIYRVEGADALEPADTTATRLFRYRENNMSAGVAHRSDYAVLAVGFPFEAIRSKEERDLIMKQTLNYLLEENE